MADELEVIRQLKARYCRLLDAQDGTWRIKTLHLTRTIQQITSGHA